MAGTYGLDQWLGSDATGAFFSTSYMPGGQRAIVKLTEASPSAAEMQLALWERTARLKHRNLMALLDCGTAETPEGPFAYAVFEAPDDSLTAALQNGPMSEDEARDVFAAGVDALRYLHSHGWAHTSIDAEHIVAVGDRIKLATDTLGEADEAGQCDDVWAMGALVYELVSGRKLERGRFAGVSGLSDPLGPMIQHATEPDVHERWTAEQLAEVLCPAPEPEIQSAVAPVVEQPFVAVPSAEVVPAAQEIEKPADIEEGESAPRMSPIVVHEPFSNVASEQVESDEDEEAEPPTLLSKYVPLAAVAAIALLALIFVIAHHGATTPQAVAIVPPPAPAPVAETTPPPIVRASVPKSSPQTWRVISYTYFRQSDAEKKAQSINSRVPGIHAEVFTLGTRPPSYLISLGAHLTQDEANALRKKAIAKGLPHDTFIRNFAN